MNNFSINSIKIPPPVVTALFALAMYGLASISSTTFTFALQYWLIGILLVLSLAMLLPAVIQFYQHKTTVNPLRPEKANKLVVTGLYRYSRNPMYLGMALILLAWCLYLANPLNLFFLVGFIAYMNRFQIMPEERALETLFKEDFIAYKQRVRRWI